MSDTVKKASIRSVAISALRLVPNVMKSFYNPNYLLQTLDELSDLGDRVRVDKPIGASTHFLFHPEDITEVFRQNHRKIGLAGKQIKMLSETSDDRPSTIVNSSGKDWQQGRQALSKHMHSKRGLKQPVMSAVERVIDDHTKSWNGRSSISLARESSHLMIKLAYRVMFGQVASPEICDSLESAAKRLHRHQVNVALSDGLLKPISLNLPQTSDAIEFFHNEVMAIREIYQKQTQKDQNILLDDLIDVDDAVSQERIGMMIRASHTTMVYTFFNAMWNISGSQDWQDRIANDDNDPITQQVIQETLRLHPAIYVIPKDVKERFVTKDGHAFSKGDSVIISPHVTNRLPDFYANPNTFDPETNQNAEAQKARHQDAFISYGVGSRKCPGRVAAEQQLSVALKKACQKFRYSRMNANAPAVNASCMMIPDGSSKLAIHLR